MFVFVRLIMFVFDMICVFVLCSHQVGRLCAGAFCVELGAGGRAVPHSSNANGQVAGCALPVSHFTETALSVSS